MPNITTNHAITHTNTRIRSIDRSLHPMGRLPCMNFASLRILIYASGMQDKEVTKPLILPS